MLITRVHRSASAHLASVKLVKGTLGVAVSGRQGPQAGVAVADSGCLACQGRNFFYQIHKVKLKLIGRQAAPGAAWWACSRPGAASVLSGRFCAA
jgi:hypothetical protein